MCRSEEKSHQKVASKTNPYESGEIPRKARQAKEAFLTFLKKWREKRLKREAAPSVQGGGYPKKSRT